MRPRPKDTIMRPESLTLQPRPEDTGSDTVAGLRNEGDYLMSIAMDQRKIAEELLRKAQTNEIKAITFWAQAEAERFKQGRVG